MALAVASGLLQSAGAKGHQPALSLKLSSDGSHVQLLQDKKLIWETGTGRGDRPISVGLIARPHYSKAVSLIGVQIGLSEPLYLASRVLFPREILTNVVVVDDRPNSGGGLPDFWQAAVAQILQFAASSTGDPHIFFWGPQSHLSQTLKHLLGTSLDVDEVAALAGVGSNVVTRLRGAVTRNTRVVASAQDLCDHLFKISTIVSVDLNRKEAAAESELLHRSMLASQKLGDIDGIRCKTAASAYPIVVDVLRRSATRDSKDEAGQTLRELLAFKLVLETPQTDAIPAYLRPQQQDMERYASAVLLDRDGKIRATLEKRPQIASFKREIVSCFAKNGEVTSTRRACLVVPHEPKAKGRPTPLGLISAWASPRIGSQHGYTVDWVFVWRTVEAFIGLPYSLFGSIKLAQALLSEIKLEGDTAPQLKMGELTYIALSLHMRVDGVHHRIAKRIVDQSSD